jgi:hypothetical protein
LPVSEPTATCWCPLANAPQRPRCFPLTERHQVSIQMARHPGKAAGAREQTQPGARRVGARTRYLEVTIFLGHNAAGNVGIHLRPGRCRLGDGHGTERAARQLRSAQQGAQAIAVHRVSAAQHPALRCRIEEIFLAHRAVLVHATCKNPGTNTSQPSQTTPEHRARLKKHNAVVPARNIRACTRP